MSDNATPDTAPGGHPDAVVINDDGTVTTRGGRGFVWVTDELSGTRVDVPARILPRGGLTPVPGYPVNYKSRARRAKPRTQLDGTPGTAPPAPEAASPPAVPDDTTGGAAGDEPIRSTTKTPKGQAPK